MGSKWFTGGVVAAPRGRIQFNFRLDGIRYRPTIKRPPSEANLRRARKRLEVIKRQIDEGTFSFANEFPDYRFLRRLGGASKVRLCNDVFDEYLAHCKACVQRDDMAAATLRGYRKILDGIWRPPLGQLRFYDVSYSRLVAIADEHDWSKKTYNNALSTLRRAFDFGYRDRPLEANPARSLTTLLRVCQELRKQHPDLTTVGNLAVRTRKTFTRTPRVLEHNDLDASALDYTLFPSHETAPASQVRTARSCAFKCSFCSFPVIAGAHEIMSLPALERSLDHLRQTGTTHLFFIDDTFNVPLKPFRDLCRLMIQKQYGFEWVCQFRCGNAQDEDFDLMAKAGCIGVLLGIESAAPDILRLMNKGAKVDRYREGIAKLKARGIITYASFIAGFPGETDATFNITRDFIRSERPDYYVIEPYFHDPRVPIAERSAEFALRGASYSWQHNTMNWKQAFDHAESAYKTITESTILPLQSADLWTLAYLRSAGFSMDLVRGFTQLAARMLVKSLRGEGQNNGSIFQNEMVPLFSQHLGSRGNVAPEGT